MLFNERKNITNIKFEKLGEQLPTNDEEKFRIELISTDINVFINHAYCC